MLVECGLAFIFNGENIYKDGGFLTTAACYGSVIKDRLVETGCTFQILEWEFEWKI